MKNVPTGFQAPYFAIGIFCKFRYEFARSASSSKVIHQSGGNSVGVFLVDILPVDSAELAKPSIFAGLNPGVNLPMIHAIGLKKDDRTHEGSVG